ncbi:gelsolin repeat protein [Ancylostoma caninum]|uniref:Gelsolin repeat protein n=1 Tax=Ancylostoma caninum TaxID=29170 RepID=A0A368F4T5_ANCCA|nr:gelsolin repeat protein [Ancylostoma caninum]
MGKKANRLLKMAGQKMVTELHQMIERPDYTQVSRETEDEESMMFRSKFAGWDDIVPVDFTRTSESVSRVPDLKVLVKRDNMMKTDLTALFLDRQPAMSPEESDELLNDCNEDLEFIESFVLEGKKFVRLPDGEFGTFYTMDCYVFLCRYAVIPEESEDEEEDDEGDQESHQDFKCVLYFWQGRDASNMGWLHFTFQLQPTFEKIFKDKLEVVRMHQQQENHKFLSHFHRKFVIRRGRRGLTRNLGGKWPELFQMRANGSSVCTRTIQIDCRATELCSGFCHILRAPYSVARDDGQKGIVYVWIGVQSDPHEHEYARKVAEEMINRHDECFPVQVIKEGEEPEEFWEFMGGKKKYETDSSFFRYTRLFRCTNEKGYFAVSEKTVDFCQDDLDDDDIMVLDNGDIVFLWLGARASEVEVKLAYKAATVYVAHLRMRQTDRPRTLKLAIKGKESRRFKKCFHAWGRHKVPAGD